MNYMATNLLENMVAGIGAEGGQSLREDLASPVRWNMQQALENTTRKAFTRLISQ